MSHRIADVDIVKLEAGSGGIESVVLELVDEAGESSRVTVSVRWPE